MRPGVLVLVLVARDRLLPARLAVQGAGGAADRERGAVRVHAAERILLRNLIRSLDCASN